MFHQYLSRTLSYNPRKIDLDTHLEHLGDSSVQGGHGQWRLSVVGKRVSLGFTYPSRANSADDLMPRSEVSKLRCGAPMNWGTLRVLASSEIAAPNPNGMWFLKNEIGYFRARHDHLVVFDISLIAPKISELQTSEDWPRYTLRAPWRLLGTGWPWTMEALCG